MTMTSPQNSYVDTAVALVLRVIAAAVVVSTVVPPWRTSSWCGAAPRCRATR